MHSAELDFVFGYLRDQAADPALTQLSEQMEGYWTNFAKTGNPNGAGLPQWPKFTSLTSSYMDFSNSGPVSKAALRSAACSIYAGKLNRDLDARTK